MNNPELQISDADAHECQVLQKEEFDVLEASNLMFSCKRVPHYPELSSQFILNVFLVRYQKAHSNWKSPFNLKNLELSISQKIPHRRPRRNLVID